MNVFGTWPLGGAWRRGGAWREERMCSDDAEGNIWSYLKVRKGVVPCVL